MRLSSLAFAMHIRIHHIFIEQILPDIVVTLLQLAYEVSEDFGAIDLLLQIPRLDEITDIRVVLLSGHLM